VTLIPRGLLPEQIDHIDGERRQPTGVLDGASLCDPSTTDLLQPRRATSPGEVDRAIAASARVHRDGVWADLDADTRVGWLERIASELDAMLDSTGDAVAVAESTGSGVPIAITRMFAGSLAGAFRGAIAQLQTGWTRTELPGPVRPVELLRLPWGPAAILVPWNAPAAMAAGKVAMALAAGCPVLLKPPEWSPLGCNLLADAIHRVGLPAGTFQMVHGGPAAGAALTGDARVKVVSYTGSLAAGRAIARAAAEHFTALQLELGGNNPAIVRSDADIEATAAALASGIVKLNGQWCEAPGKVLVARERHDELVDALREHLGRWRIGHHLDDDTQVGPLSHEAHRTRLDAQMVALEAIGGEQLFAGELPDLPGWFWSPRLVVGADPSACVDELFGPVVTVHPVADDGAAVTAANDTPFGLAGYVFSTDLDAAQALGRRIRFGEVKINGTSVIDLTPTSTQSFWGLSGIGGHGNAEVFRSFTGSQIVGVDHTDVPI
jgi:betaine-aldehyde dehydrogenase